MKLFLLLFGLAYFAQIACVIASLMSNRFSTKKEFLIELLPFYCWIYCVFDKFKKLK